MGQNLSNFNLEELYDILSSDQVKAIDLEVQNKTRSEMSAILGVSESAIRNWRAEKAYREAIKKKMFKYDEEGAKLRQHIYKIGLGPIYDKYIKKTKNNDEELENMSLRQIVDLMGKIHKEVRFDQMILGGETIGDDAGLTEEHAERKKSHDTRKKSIAATLKDKNIIEFPQTNVS